MNHFLKAGKLVCLEINKERIKNITKECDVCISGGLYYVDRKIDCEYAEGRGGASSPSGG